MDIAGAEKKLRQATFFLGHLEQLPKDNRAGRDPEHLEFFFSACLSAAQSIYYVLDETGGKEFRERQRRWRAALPEPERLRFGRMIGLRGKDVHLAKSGAETVPKYVEEDRSRYTITSIAMFGYEALVEMENPDGTKVSAPVLRGSVGLYVEQEGQRIEAVTACREFIGQLCSLVDAVKAAQMTSLAKK
jgi:hypothetical protein